MSWTEISHAIEHVAPLIGSVVTGPYGVLAGNLISKALGVSTTPENVMSALQSDPTAMDKIKALEDVHGYLLSLLNNLKSPSKINLSITVDFNRPN